MSQSGRSEARGERLEVVESSAQHIVVFLKSGKRLVPDLVLLSAGRQGATDGLNLSAAGLKADDRGRLTVDREYRTSVPHIFAAGDVVGFPSLATTSAEQGRLAACAAFGLDALLMASYFPIGIYAIPEVSTVGEPEHVLTARRFRMRSGVARYREIARGHIMRNDSGFLKMLFVGRTAVFWASMWWTRCDGIDPYRPSGIGATWRSRLFPRDGIHLSDAREILRGRCPGCLQEAIGLE